MRLYHNKPPRRRKPRAKAMPGAKPRWRLDGGYTALIGLLLVLAALRVTVAFALPDGPAVGDRVAITPAKIAPNPIIAAREVANPFARPGNSCMLDVNEMSHPGGALSVMAVRTDGVLLSWAGGATSAKADCRRENQEILISADDYDTLLKAELPKH